MAVPADPDARLFYRAAQARRVEAGVLLAAGHGTGAIYLAGYAVECTFKALLLTATPAADRAAVVASFKGAGGHSLQGLRDRYVVAGGAFPPTAITEHFNRVQKWGTPLRYSPAETPIPNARRFLASVDALSAWADGRL